MTNQAKQISFKPVVLDIDGKILSEEDIKRITHKLTGGVILFSRNFESRLQLQELCSSIKKHAPDIIIFIDHEGGRVQRCKTDGFTHLPAMQRLGDLYNKNPWEGLQASKAAGFILASELKACGVDFSYTPVLDLNYGKSEVIGNRAFSSDSHITAILAGALIDGLKLAGMASCGKHFPGHGFVEADSHTAIPIDERGFQQIWKTDIVPYMLLIQKLDSIMPAHIIYKQIAKEPAGFSSFWLQDVLRSRLEFDGIIFSDDLAMEGASVAGNVIQGAQAALSAGCDMVLICNKPDMADELLAGLQYKLEYAKASQQRLNRIMPISFKCDLNWDKLQEYDLYIDSKSILIKHGLI